jgi:hypothetical protein
VRVKQKVGRLLVPGCQQALRNLYVRWCSCALAMRVWRLYLPVSREHVRHERTVTHPWCPGRAVAMHAQAFTPPHHVVRIWDVAWRADLSCDVHQQKPKFSPCSPAHADLGCVLCACVRAAWVSVFARLVHVMPVYVHVHGQQQAYSTPHVGADTRDTSPSTNEKGPF